MIGASFTPHDEARQGSHISGDGKRGDDLISGRGTYESASYASGVSGTSPSAGILPAHVYLTNLHLESFGRFHDRNIGPFSPGLNVVYGQNEAGKSTATAFVRQMLYGWTSNRSSENTYDPSAGGRSGSLFFTDGVGEWELHRGKKKDDIEVIRHEGPAWDDAFADICSNVAEDTYRTVFSFNAEELMSLPSDSGSMTAKLFTAGSGTHIAPTQVRQEMHDAAKRISGKRGDQEEALGNLREALKQTRDEIAELSEKARGYSEERIELAQLERDQSERATRIVELKRRISELEADRARAETAYGRKDKLLNEKQAVDKTFRRQQRQREDQELSDEEQLLLTHAMNIEKAFRESANLQSGYDRMMDYEADLRRAREQLADRQNPGCGVGPALRREIVARKEQSVKLGEEVRHDKDLLKKAQLKMNTLEAADDGTVAEEVLTKPRKGLIAAGIVGAAVGVGALVFAVIAHLSSLATMGVSLIAGIAGVVLLALGVVCIIMGMPRQDSAEMEDRRARRQEAVQTASEDFAYADGVLSQALEEQQAYREECAEFFEENGLDPDLKDFDLALDMLVEQEEYNRKAAEVSTLEERYLRSRREFNGLYSLVQKSLMPVSTDVVKVRPGDIVSHIAELHRRLKQAQDRGQEYHVVEDATKRSEAQVSQVDDALDSEKNSIAEIASRYDIDDSGNIMPELARLLAETQRESDALEQAQNESSARHGNLTSILDAGAKETDLQRKRLYYEELKARQGRSAQRYAELVCAQELLTRSIRIWEEEKQPEVYRLASELFADMTSGKWSKVVSEGDEIFVFDASRHRFPTDKLSTGTTQQLYLSLRIALLLTAREAGRDLPVIADDILVSFDASRRQGAARALKRLAEERQVIMFTCHRSTQDLLAGPEVNSFDI